MAAACERIACDNRHLAVQRVSATPVTERLFPAWTMRDDPAQSWLWNPAEIDDGALDSAPPATVLAVFVRLAATAPA